MRPAPAADIYERLQRTRAVARKSKQKARAHKTLSDDQKQKLRVQVAEAKRRRENDVMAYLDMRRQPGTMELVARQLLLPGYTFPVATVAQASQPRQQQQEQVTLSPPQLAYRPKKEVWERSVGQATALSMLPSLPQLAELHEGWRMGSHISAGDTNAVNCELVPAPYYKPADVRLGVRAGTAFVGAYVVVTRPVSPGQALVAAVTAEASDASNNMQQQPRTYAPVSAPSDEVLGVLRRLVRDYKQPPRPSTEESPHLIAYTAGSPEQT